MIKNLFGAVFTLAIFILLLQEGYARQMQVSAIPASDRLPSTTVNRIFQDKEGYIWIGTPEGLCRYDAYRILNIKPAPIDHNQGSDNVISIDETGEFLLIGTDKGLRVLNKKTCQTGDFPDKQLQNRMIRSLLVDKEQNIWIGTDGPLLVYRPDFTLKKTYRTSSFGGPIPGGGVSSIYEDSNGDIWLCFWNGGLYKYNKKTNSFTAFPKIGANNNPFKVFEDNRKNYWVCTWGGGLFLFHPNKNGKNIYTEIPVRNKRRKNEKEQLFYNVVQDDHFGYIWVMSFSGITAFEYTSSGDIREKDVSGLFANTNNIFTDLHKDRDGNLWVAAFGDGILTINFNKPSIQNRSFSFIKEKYGISASFTMLYEDSEGRMWFNMDRLGPGIFNPHTGRTELYSEYPELAGLTALRAVSCAIQPSGSEEVWLGSANLPVITVFERKQGFPGNIRTIDLKRYYNGAGNLLGFFEDSRNNLWISTTKGLLVKPFNHADIRPVITISDNISGIAEDKQGNIWIASARNGLYRAAMPAKGIFFPLEIIHFQKIKGITDTGIRDITADRRGNIWIASATGKISYYNLNSRQFRKYEGASIAERILDMTCDKNDNVWVSTSRQIFRIDPFKSLSGYSVEDGLAVNMFMKKAYTESRTDNKIYFGGNNGICAFNTLPDKFNNKDKHKIQITDIKINNESVLNNPERGYPFELDKLILDHDDGNLEIDFSSLNYEFPNKIRYAYKLDGVDGDWIYPDKGRRFAIYNNLSKGDYTFLVKATGPDNIWHNEPLQLSIYKKPVFYETNIAYLIYAAMVVALVYAWFRFTSYRLKLRSDLRIAQIEREKTEELAQSKISYFTGISHDFLTPLTIISCLIDDIQITTKRNLPQYEKMRSNVNRLKRLLQQILDFRRIESGNMQLKISRGDIVGFIRELCVNHFMPLAERKHIDFTIEPAFSETNAYFDADKIDKIFFNILSNAFKYTPEGGGILVQLHSEKHMQNDFLVARISDTGIGIPEEELGKIFTPFYNNPTTRIESNGIGLSLTKNLVEIHHGSIEVESGLNHGTSFTVRIPLSAGSYNENELNNVAEIISEESDQMIFPPEKEIKDETLREDEELNRLNLLLVDDNEDLLGTVENLLKEYYRVYSARNGLQALDIVNKTEIDIIVSDVMMPGMDGLQLCRSLKSDINTSHIPVILLTAKNSVDDRVECYNAGADGYISKPFELKVLVARINNFIANKKNRQSGFKSSYDINISLLDHPSIDEHFLKATIDTIEGHLTETDFDVVVLAKHMNMSRSTLYRKIKVLVGVSPNEFIKNIRLKHACQFMLRDKSVSVSEVAFSTGFSDPRYFATCFKAEFGITPSEYQKRNEKTTK